MKKKTIIILSLVLVLVFIAFAALCIYVFKMQRAAERKGYEILTPYRDMVLEYAESSDELKELYGEDFNLKLHGASYKYTSDKYINLLVYRKDPQSSEELLNNVEYLDFNIEINEGNYYVVRIEKDQNGKAFVSDLSKAQN